MDVKRVRGNKDGSNKQEFNLHEDIDRELLIHQNTALSNRLDHKNRQILEINEKLSNLQRRSKGYELLFSNLFGSWRQFMKKLQNIHILTKRQNGENTIYSQLMIIYDTLRDIEIIPERIYNQKPDEIGEIQKFIKAQFGDFTQNTQNFYIDWLCEYVNNSKHYSEVLKNLLENQDNEKELVRKLFAENSSLKEEIQKFDNYFKQKSNLESASAAIEAQTLHLQLNTLQEKHKWLQDSYEISTRRLRQLMDYCNPAIQSKAIMLPKNSIYASLAEAAAAASAVKQSISDNSSNNLAKINGNQSTSNKNLSSMQSESPKSISNKQKSGETSMLLEDASNNSKSGNAMGDAPQDDYDFQCICGGSQFNYIQLSFQKSLEATALAPISAPIVNELGGQSSQQMNQSNSNINGISGNSQQNNGLMMNSINIATIMHDLTALQQKNEDLTDQNVTAKQEIEKLKMQLKNNEEGLFNSTVFKNLVEQSQELIQYIAYLQQQHLDMHNKILDIEKDRTREVQQLIQKHTEDREKLMNEIHNLKLEQNRLFHSDQLKEQLAQYDIGAYIQPHEQRIEHLQGNIDHLHNQNISLLAQLDATQKKCDEEAQKNQENFTQTLKLEDEIKILRSRIPGQFNTDGFVFRHQQHKDFIAELEASVSEQLPQYQQKLKDLILYIKSRDSKVESIENKMKEMKNKEEQQRKQIENFLSELTLTNNGYTEVNKHRNELLAVIKSKDEEIVNLINERNLEQTLAVGDKVSYNSSSQTYQEHIKQLKLEVEEYKEQLRVTQDLMTSLQEENNTYKAIKETAIAEVEQYLQTIEELNINLRFSEDRFTKIEASLNDSIQQIEQVRIQKKNVEEDLFQKNDFIQKLEEQGDAVMRLELQKYRDMIICSICQSQQQQLVISQCNHLFCQQCIDNNLKNRNRNCPQCRTKFGENDVQEIFWN